MSMFICKICENHIDSDFDESFEYKDSLICEPCFDELIDQKRARYPDIAALIDAFGMDTIGKR